MCPEHPPDRLCCGSRVVAVAMLHMAPEVILMFRFEQLIRSSMSVRDVKAEFPDTVPVFESYGFRDVCDDCSIEVVARRQGLSPMDVVDDLNQLLLSKGKLHSRE